MKEKCTLIRELLPLYHDHVCSQKTEELIKEHLDQCEDCRNYYNELYDLELAEENLDSNAKEAFKIARKNIRNRQIFIYIIIAILFTLFFYQSTRPNVNSQDLLSIQDMTIQKIEVDGKINFQIATYKPKMTYEYEYNYVKDDKEYKVVVCCLGEELPTDGESYCYIQSLSHMGLVNDEMLNKRKIYQILFSTIPNDKIETMTPEEVINQSIILWQSNQQ